ncbi:sarcocystatin-A-like [Bactrocera tryoni]|uniref:sarcocystatin-A-like n=1 Tax=Bactrocera tryoni TaxID=59916 RepID=UPI001A95AD32|nr:sarcocystatin-A-like [Bactrocera tryoni]
MISAKLFVLLGCVIAVVVAVPEGHLVGGATPLSGEDLKRAQEELQNSLTKLATGDGPAYKISKVNSASSQVVSGTLYKFNVDLIAGNDEVKNCNVEIWSQRWLPEGIQVTFDCEGEEKIVRKHSA